MRKFLLLITIATTAAAAFAAETNTVAVAVTPAPVVTNHPPYSPDVLSGQGIAQHPFLYPGQYDTRKPTEQTMFIVRRGKIVLHYFVPITHHRGASPPF